MKILDKNIEIAKKIIAEEVLKAGYKVERIILFGSRARGDFKEDSDYDFFVIVDKEVSGDEMLMLYSNISKELSKERGKRYMETDISVWVKQALEDLEIAKDLFNADKQRNYRLVCFESQQCVEKLLKAYLISSNRPIEKNYNIRKFIDNCSLINPVFQELYNIINPDILTAYATIDRYPASDIIFNDKKAKEAIFMAEKTAIFVLEKLNIKNKTIKCVLVPDLEKDKEFQKYNRIYQDSGLDAVVKQLKDDKKDTNWIIHYRDKIFPDKTLTEIDKAIKAAEKDKGMER